MTNDQKRELEKILETVQLALKHHAKQNEANSALHASDRIIYSPLTVKLQTAEQSLLALIKND
jgi:hypothetical protein